MRKITLDSIHKSSGRIEYLFSFSDELQPYFSKKPFGIDYAENIEMVPDSIAAIPFVCNVLPIMWLKDATLLIPTLDQDFHDCINKVKAGFENMYPETTFGGQLITNHIEKNAPLEDETERYNSACFFSGGVDATTTVFRHIAETPLLVTLWGSDIRTGNASGWEEKQDALNSFAHNFHLPITYVRTAFRDFDSEGKMNREFRLSLGKNYWYGVKHGIGIISHIAPLIWLHHIQRVYFASSNCPEDGVKVRCASDPRIDNQLRFCGAQVYHDSFELNRQKKVRLISEFHKTHSEIPLSLHVCWESDSGRNCCHCEKCYRTMAELWIEGEDPRDYGFDYSPDVFESMYQSIALHCEKMASNTWTYGKERLIENWKTIRKKDYAKKIKWIKSFDFKNLDRNWNRKVDKLFRRIKYVLHRLPLKLRLK